jgi:hypothetical protein
MAIQISGSQIKNNAVSSSKMDLTGSFDFSSGTLLSATPTADSQVANKAYVDNIAAGLSWKAPAKVATVANITLSGTQTIDGVAVSAGDRVLVKDQTDATYNGVYVVASGSWARSADMDANADFPSASIFVQQGSTNADIGYVCSNDSVTLGSTEITFVQFNGASNIIAGDGLAKTGNELSVNVDNVTLEIYSDALQVKNNAIDTAQLADGAVTSDKLAGNIPNAKLQYSTISGVALGSNLASLSTSASGAISMTSYDGSTASADMAVNVDGVTLEIATNAVQIKQYGVDTNQLADASVTTAKLADEAVTTSILADANVTTAKLAALSVTSAKIANSAVTSTQLSDGAVTSSKIVDGSVVGVKLADGSVSDTKIVDGAVTSAKIASSAVTSAKIANSAVGTSQLADSGVTNAKLAGSITADKLTLGNGMQNFSGSLQAKVDGTYVVFDPSNNIGISFSSHWKSFSPNGVQTTFDLDYALLGKFSSVLVFKNGLAVEQVASGASGSDQYSITLNGGSGKGQIVFGSAPLSGDNVRCFYIA